jgi:phospho-N-acetylmuramoyl-pentapeptide-transferase
VIALVIAGAVAMLVSLTATPVFIRWLQARGIGQPIREDGPEGHVTKAGTPTMGGLMIVLGAFAGYVVSHVRGGTAFTRTGIVVILVVVGAGIVGLIDDWLKVTRQHNLGLNKRAKMAGQLVVGIGFAIAALEWLDVSTNLSFTRFDQPGIDLTSWGWAVWAVLVITAMSNAVNFTDGLDGLAAGSSAFSFSAFVIIGFWHFRHNGTYAPEGLPPQAFGARGLDLAIVAVAMVGACAGFLWWNAAPARIYMGDTGSLAIGAGLASLALTMNTHLLLPVIGGLFVMETVSVTIQVAAFQLFKRRVFRMAPIHHHFELLGWPETTVIVRFWILAGLSTALALGMFYADFINLGGTLD